MKYLNYAIYFFVGLAVILWLYNFFFSTSVDNQQIDCTMEAMECPDGTFVGRTGPNCEFVCPE